MDQRFVTILANYIEKIMKNIFSDCMKMSMPGIMLAFCFLIIPTRHSNGHTDYNGSMGVKNQQVLIRGTISDEEGQTLIGATIIFKNDPANGTITDADGNFSIQADPGDILVFSYLGMETQEVLISDQLQLSIILKAESTELTEVMVIAYGTAKRETFTGSASVVRSDKIESRPVSSFTATLAGNATGVVVSTSGMPGRNDVVRIRGTGSYNASNAPLYVIDGVPVNMSDMSQMSSVNSNPMATINPSDIASITVLKDAAASSLYGSRAANGVILITTKQGNEGRTNFNLDVQYGIAEGLYDKPMADKDEFAELWITGELHRTMALDAIFTGLSGIEYIKNTYENENTYDFYLERARTNFNNTFSYGDSIYDFWGDGYSAYPNTDWYDVVSRRGGVQKINLSASGGQKGLTFYTSGEYFKQTGTIIGSDLTRISGRLNLSSKTNKIAWFGVNMAMSYYNQNGPLLGNLYANPLRAAANIPPVAPVYIDGEPNLSLPGDILNNYNPVAIMDLNIYNTNISRALGTAWIQLNLAKGFYFKSTLGYDYRPQIETRWENRDIGTGAGYEGRHQEIGSRRRRLTSSSIINYNLSIKGKHNLSFLAGWESEWTHTNRLGGVSIGYVTNLTPILSSGTTPTETIGRTFDDALLSAISRITYNYNNKYYAQASYRADGSSRFGRDNRWGHFYSFSGSWRLSQESFLDNIRWLDDAKIRASYGINGTLPSGLYDYLGNYTLGYDYHNMSGARVTNVANMGLSWEQSANINLGAEIKVLSGRLFASAEYFKREAKDLLFDREISRTTGFTNATVNLGSMKNYGFEITLDAFPVRTSKFSWNLILNLSKITNIITDLPNDIVGTTNIDRKGYAEGSLYLPEWAGVDPGTGSPMWYHVNDTSGEKTITMDYSEATRQIIGTREPIYVGGLASNFSFWNFDLDMLFSFAWEFNTLDYSASRYTQTDGGQSFLNSETPQLDSWTPVDTMAGNPMRINGLTNGSQFSTRHTYNGAYFKMKNIKLSYQIPGRLLGRLRVSACKLFIQAENLFVLTEMPNFDPEIRVNGYRYVYDFPPPRIYTVGINLSF